jgi:hypothetical protein
MRKKLKSTALCLVLAFSLSSTASFAVQGGSIGQGDFSVLNGDKVVDTLKGQNPLDESSMLVCDGKCMVKSEGISLVAADQAKFAIKNDGDTFRLFLQAGSVDYVITEKARKIAFHTPEGVYSVAEIIFNAASDPVVRGTVTVTKDGKTEVSVKEGKLVFATADGMKTVNANEKIVLAQAIPPPVAPAVRGGSIIPWVVGGGAAILAGAIIVANNNDNNGNNPGPNNGNNPPPGPKPKPPKPPRPPHPASPST